MQTQGTVAALTLRPSPRGSKSETQDRRSSAAAAKHQSPGQNWAQAMNPCPFTPRKKRKTVYSGSAMLQGRAQG